MNVHAVVLPRRREQWEKDIVGASPRVSGSLLLLRRQRHRQWRLRAELLRRLPLVQCRRAAFSQCSADRGRVHPSGPYPPVFEWSRFKFRAEHSLHLASQSGPDFCNSFRIDHPEWRERGGRHRLSAVSRHSQPSWHSPVMKCISSASAVGGVERRFTWRNLLSPLVSRPQPWIDCMFFRVQSRALHSVVAPAAVACVTCHVWRHAQEPLQYRCVQPTISVMLAQDHRRDLVYLDQSFSLPQRPGLVQVLGTRPKTGKLTLCHRW